METKFFINCEDELSLKDRAQKLKDFLNLNDPANKSLFNEVKAEYNYLLATFKPSQPVTDDKAKEPTLDEIIAALIPLDKVKLEICGNWVWIGGDTRPHKNFLKKLRCRFSPGKKAWYWRPKQYKSVNQDPIDMDMIREIYGSVAVY